MIKDLTTPHQSLEDNNPATAIEYPIAIHVRTHLGPPNPTGSDRSPSAVRRMTRVTTPTINPRKNPPGPAQKNVSAGNDPRPYGGETAVALGKDISLGNQHRQQARNCASHS